jgi:hypothetical protein
MKCVGLADVVRVASNQDINMAIVATLCAKAVLIAIRKKVVLARYHPATAVVAK